MFMKEIAREIGIFIDRNKNENREMLEVCKVKPSPNVEYGL